MSQALALSAGDPDLLKSPEVNLENFSINGVNLKTLLEKTPEAAVDELLGDYANITITRTPVKTKVVQGDIVSPTFKKAISSLGNKQEILEKSQELLKEKDVKIAMLNEKIAEQADIIEKQQKELNSLRQILNNVQNALSEK